MNANLQMLLHAPPVQAVLCSMPVPPPPSDGPPTPRAEEPTRNLGNPSLVYGSKPETEADPGAAANTASADAAPSLEGSAETASNAVLQPSSNDRPAGAPDQGQEALAERAESAPCGFSPDRAALPSIEEHPEATQAPLAAQPAQAQAPAAPEEAPLPAGMTVKTSVEEAADAGDANADSSRSQTPVSLAGVATPDIAHPPSAVEALQRGHQPWAAADAPASLLQTGVASSGSKYSSAPAAPLSREELATTEDRRGDTPSVPGAVPGSANGLSEGTVPAEAAEAATEGGGPRPSIALPAPEAMPALKPGELFCAFRRFAHEVGSAVSAVTCTPLHRELEC